jgi:excinuclease ABC subunit C
MSVLNGNISELIEELKKKMGGAVEKRKYEKAALFRDMIGNLEEIFSHNRRSFRFAKAAGAKNPLAALQSLQKILHLPDLPLIINCFDISNISGSLAVASKVCFKDGRPATAYYRRFRIRGESPVEVLKRKITNGKKKNTETYPLGYGGDDYAMIAEAVARAYVDIVLSSDNQKLPDLIIIDGGIGQLNAAINALKTIAAPEIPIFGLAKKNEEIIVPNSKSSITLDKHSSALRLLQAIRDESHRFAVAYHRKLRAERIQESMLDDISGIGPVRRNALLTAFGSIKKLKKASVDDICRQVPGINQKIAEQIVTALHSK